MRLCAQSRRVLRSTHPTRSPTNRSRGASLRARLRATNPRSEASKRNWQVGARASWSLEIRRCNLPMNWAWASACRCRAGPLPAIFRQPMPELIAQSNLQRFIDKHQLGSYDELMRRSTTDIAWFWDTVLRDLDIQFYKPYSCVVNLSEGKPWAKWCVDGEMNVIHNMLDKYAGTPTDEK